MIHLMDHNRGFSLTLTNYWLMIVTKYTRQDKSKGYGEVQCQLYIACDVGYLDETAFRSIHDQALAVSRIIGGLQASIKRQQKL